MTRKIYFLTSPDSVGKSIFQVVSLLYPAMEWHLFTIHTAAEREAFEAAPHDPDVIISFLNGYILPAWLLERVHGAAFNVHPETPDYPGRDPQHFAFYEGSSTAGATLHRMEAHVDSGEILDVVTVPVERAAGVMNYIERSAACSIAVLIKNLEAILEGTIQAKVQRQWRGSARRSRQDFADMCRIEPTMEQSEIQKRIDAFYNPAHKSIHVDIHGYRFVYDPAPEKK